MTHFFCTFLRDDDGAVTVDWVVLTAAIVGLGLMVIIGITASLQSRTDHITTTIVATVPN
ncbi:hypothetical protein SAMN04488003_11445 [Loktanella fryxellensis]|uniref:Flp pilus assembly protein, pilin Flp n=1 Tax=Loktanella fryxellensis TaxID=245187 RepID=A0A1H8FZH1_9RHOB|nr:hypothetical protein [Loktanella fryxellensis]SEN37039.1 hypothetical protein SAMN04488003_11445 [Loktanella fryxellensis]